MSDGTKKLHRSKDDRWLAGVCGGLAEYFDIDGTVVRVLFILFGFAVGGGLLIYIILWIIMPEAPDGVMDVGSIDDLKAEETDTGFDEAEQVEEDAPDGE